MTKDELRPIIAAHREWLNGPATGKRADLTGADLTGADLTGADLTWADLTGAYMEGAYMSGAYMSGANLSDADMTGADLAGADLTGAYLAGAKLAGAILTGTVLDPSLAPNGDAKEFARNEDGRCIGYRTKNSEVIDRDFIYTPGEHVAPVFSCCPITECHPGLYVKPAREKGDITVTFDAKDCHRIRDKWRVKRFTVLEAS